MKSNSNIESWHKVCNMRSTLLQLQYLYCSISEQLQQQSQNFEYIQKDRLVQFEDISKTVFQISSNNYKILLIAKIESLLDCYLHVDQGLWKCLNQFMACVQFLSEEMEKDVCKLYIGTNMMVDIGKCEEQLRHIETKIVHFLQVNQESFNDYNKGIQAMEELNESWKLYLKELMTGVRDKVEPAYPKYLRKKLQAEVRQLDSNIEVLKRFIKMETS